MPARLTEDKALRRCPPSRRAAGRAIKPSGGRHTLAVGLAAMPATTQSALQVDVIKQYGGLVTIQRRVKVKVPGKHFPQLQPAGQRVEYEGEAIEFVERHVFPKHVKAWGAASM